MCESHNYPVILGDWPKETGMMYFPTKWGAKEPQNHQNHLYTYYKIYLKINPSKPIKPSTFSPDRRRFHEQYPTLCRVQLKTSIRNSVSIGVWFRNAWNPKQPFLNGSMFGETSIKKWYVLLGFQECLCFFCHFCVVFIFSRTSNKQLVQSGWKKGAIVWEGWATIYKNVFVCFL